MGTDVLLTAESAVEYLGSRGLVDAGSARAEVLGGGVSNVVVAVRDQAHHLVVKQSLPQLRVSEEWLAPQGRILTEADALQLAASLVPGSAPALVHRDAARHTIVLKHAPSGWSDWKSALLAGRPGAPVAARLGKVVAKWHFMSADPAPLPKSFADTQAFELLRIDPYYRTTAERAPDIGPAILAVAEEMTRRRRCFVRGDLSPKNILIDERAGETSEACMVIDFEVAHFGDPSFDLAFLISHLTMKALHLPNDRSTFDRCIDAFAETYSANAGALQPDWSYVLSHVGCLLLARVRGKSPAEYLTCSQRDAAWRLGIELLVRPPRDVAGLYRLRDEALI